MFKKILMFLLISFTVAGCVNDLTSSAYSYRPSTSVITIKNYITITKSNFSQYFSGTVPQPDNSNCRYAGCKLPATYSFSFEKKSNFKIDSSLYISFTGTAAITVFDHLGGQKSVTGTVSGAITMTGTAYSFNGKYTVNAFCSGCGSATVRIATPRWEISSISGRIYY